MARGDLAMLAVKEEEDEGVSSPLTFDIPEGFSPPDDVTVGSEFDSTIRLTITDDGKLKLVSINGIPFAAAEVEREDDEMGEEDEVVVEEGDGDLDGAMTRYMAGER